MTSTDKLARINEQRKARLADLDAAHAFKSLRVAHGLSQQSAAALLHRSRRNIQQFEWAEAEIDPAIWELFQYKVTLLTTKGK